MATVQTSQRGRASGRLLLAAGLVACLCSCGPGGAGPMASTPAAGILNIAATCRDVAAVRRIAGELGSGTVTLPRRRRLTRSLKAAADDLVANVTDDTSTDARTYDAAVATLLDYTDRASSTDQLRSEAASDATLQPALADAATSLQGLVSWRAANCR